MVDLLKPPYGTFDPISAAVLYESCMRIAARGRFSDCKSAQQTCEARVMHFAARAVSGREILTWGSPLSQSPTKSAA